jgi:hypothetical protein
MTTRDLYPHTFEQWIALVGALTPFLVMAGSAVWRAWTYAGEQRQREWERLGDLMAEGDATHTSGLFGLNSEILRMNECPFNR